MVFSFLGGCVATALASLFHAVYTKYDTLSLLSINRSDHHIMTMQIQPDETRFSFMHETPP
jgi:hypothetical protein